MLRFRHRLKKLKKIKMLRRQRARDRFFYSENRITNIEKCESRRTNWGGYFC